MANTLEDLKSKSDRELDALIAERIIAYYETTGEEGITVMTPQTANNALPYTSDLNLAAQVEEAVIAKVGYHVWFDAFRVAVVQPRPGLMFETYRATARERVIACLLAIGGEE